MNQHRIFKILQLIEILKHKPGKSVTFMATFLGISIRSAFRYLRLFEELGYELIKDDFGHYSLCDTKFNELINNLTND